VDQLAIRAARRRAVDQDLVPGPIGNVKAMFHVVHRHSTFVEGIRKGQARRERETVGAPRETVGHIVGGAVGGREYAAIVISGK